MILLQESGYRINWTGPIPVVNGMEMNKEELLMEWTSRHGWGDSVESMQTLNSKEKDDKYATIL